MSAEGTTRFGKLCAAERLELDGLARVLEIAALWLRGNNIFEARRAVGHATRLLENVDKIRGQAHLLCDCPCHASARPLVAESCGGCAARSAHQSEAA